MLLFIKMNAFCQFDNSFLGHYLYKSKDNVTIQMTILEQEGDTSRIVFAIQYDCHKSDFSYGIELFPTDRFEDNYDEEFNFFVIEKNKFDLETEMLFSVGERVDIDMGKDVWRNYIENEKLKIIFHNDKTVSLSFSNITKLINEHFRKAYTSFDNVTLTKK